MKKITKKMMIGEALGMNPKVADVLLDNGVHCIGCGGVSFETIEQGLKAHGMSAKEIDILVKEINDPKKIVITKAAESKIRSSLAEKYKYLRIKAENKKIKLSLEKSKNKQDKEIIEMGIRIIFDKKYSKIMNGIKIDYLAEKGGFVLK